MKKVLLIIIVAISCYNVNFAQSKNRVGVVFGPNYFSLRGSDFEDVKSEYGFMIGFSYEYKFNKNLSLVTGISIDKKQLNYTSQFTDGYFDESGQYQTEDYSVKTKNKYTYFNVPVLLKYSFGKNASFFVNGGFFVSNFKKHSMSSRITIRSNGYSYNINTTNEYNFSNSGALHSNDYGVSFGLGKLFKLNNRTYFTLELRDNFGLDDGKRTNKNMAVRTNTVNLLAQFAIDL